MSLLRAVEVPLTILITVLTLVETSYQVVLKYLETDKLTTDAPMKDILIIAFAMMSMVGIFSQKKHFVVFTFCFMILSFVTNVFNLVHLVNLVAGSMPDNCRVIYETTMFMTENGCWAIDAILIVLAASMVFIAAIAAMSVYGKLNGLEVRIMDREMATSRFIRSDEPRLIRRVSITSPIQDFSRNDVEASKKILDDYGRKMNSNDLFV